MKNKLLDLHNHLFAVVEKLMDDDLTGEKLKEEILRARTVAKAAEQIIAADALMVAACRLVEEITPDIKVPDILLDKENETLYLSEEKKKRPYLLAGRSHETA